MKKTILSLLASTLMLLLASGCWDRQEMNDLGIVLAMAVDKGKNNMLEISCQVVVPSEVASNSGKSTTTPVTLYQASAPTILEAISKMSLTSPRINYMSHIRVLIFSEAVAKMGIADELENLLRQPEVRPDYNVMIARHSKAAEILNILTPLESIPANNLYLSLQNSAKTWSPTITATADVLLEKMVNDGIEPVLTGVEIIGNKKEGGSKDNLTSIKPKANLTYTGMAVLRKDKLIGWMNEQESKGYNYITNNVKSTTGNLPCPHNKGKLSVAVLRSNTDVVPKVVDGKPVMHIKVKNMSSIMGDGCTTPISSQDDIKALEKVGSEKLIILMKKAVETAQKQYKVDIFGFGQNISRNNPKLWAQLRDHWEEEFPKLKVEYEVHVQTRRVGMLDDSILKDIKE
ncbi:spore gernimation protein GerC [Paenibacillus sp. BIHB 4019]|uniref:Spore gernimation protein GerC n=1 Tax=Paenibacillus sp. BIHB 4019 TaxID=1870819 RepID=A0A1B2DQF2_9BACL|nr:Ger(x)C family spore germination protein [Paenibacillus sp. BIHB 4019]ANY69927.1 spore gernimation protein GerC [Paenibacillus sp. BIHB 4019]